jgi:hypothetical protein
VISAAAGVGIGAALALVVLGLVVLGVRQLQRPAESAHLFAPADVDRWGTMLTPGWGGVDRWGCVGGSTQVLAELRRRQLKRRVIAYIQDKGGGKRRGGISDGAVSAMKKKAQQVRSMRAAVAVAPLPAGRGARVS